MSNGVTTSSGDPGPTAAFEPPRGGDPAVDVVADPNVTTTAPGRERRVIASSLPASLHRGGAPPTGGDGTVGLGSLINGRFSLDALLGRGGMGVVYRAVDRRKQEAQDRDPYVAIKILRDEFRLYPSALIALQREARKAQTLAHPNVVTVHDFDRDGGTVYMTMELLDGEPLDQVVAANPHGLPKDRALAAIRGIAAALAYAHRKAIVHSDLKPGNVFLTRRGEVKVLDFGIARAVPTRFEPNADQTVFDVAQLGALTPPYASPEMLSGQAPVSADDVFALGLVAYELLVGRHPFGGVPADEARRKGLTPPDLPISRRQRRVLAKALAFERSARYADAAAFVKDLDGPSPMRRVGYATALALLAGAAVFGWYPRDPLAPATPWESLSEAERAAFDEAIGQGRAALDQAGEAGAFALNDALSYFDRAFAIHRNNPAAIDGLEAVADAFIAELRGAPAADQAVVFGKLYCQSHLATYRSVQAACAAALGAERCTPAAMRCGETDVD